MALPKNNESERTRRLQGILDSVDSSVAFAEWPLLTHDDCLLIGRLVYLFNFIEMNMRRMVEAWQEYGLVEIKGRAQDLHICAIETTVQTMFPWQENELAGLKQLAHLRTVRNMVAHFAAKRFPEPEDAFLFIAKSEKDFKLQFPNVLNASNLMLTVIVPGPDLQMALNRLEKLQDWLGHATADLIKAGYDRRLIVPSATGV